MDGGEFSGMMPRRRRISPNMAFLLKLPKLFLKTHLPSNKLEQGRKDPDAAARAYLVVIGKNPDVVAEALRAVA